MTKPHKVNIDLVPQVCILIKIQAQFSCGIKQKIFVWQQSSRVFFVRGFGRALFIYGGKHMSFAENFKAARKSRGMTQKELAEKLDMDRSSIAKYENGNGLPHAKTLHKICEILDITIDSLFKE